MAITTDAHGSRHLSNSGATEVPGKVGNAAFIGAGNLLSLETDAGIEFVWLDFYCFAWLKFAATPTSWEVPATKRPGETTGGEWQIRIGPVTGGLLQAVFYGPGGERTLNSDLTPTPGEWAFVEWGVRNAARKSIENIQQVGDDVHVTVTGHGVTSESYIIDGNTCTPGLDGVYTLGVLDANTLVISGVTLTDIVISGAVSLSTGFICINRGTEVSGVAAVVEAGTTLFLGSDGAGNSMNGAIDQVAIFSLVPDASYRNAVYNSGEGVALAGLPSTLGLVAFYELGENTPAPSSPAVALLIAGD